MKYDIAKNEDGPLRSTLRTEQTSSAEQLATSGHQTVLESRLRDIEDHLAVRYGILTGITFPETRRSNKFSSSPIASKLDHGQA